MISQYTLSLCSHCKSAISLMCTPQNMTSLCEYHKSLKWQTCTNLVVWGKDKISFFVFWASLFVLYSIRCHFSTWGNTIITQDNEPLGCFLKWCKDGQQCLKISWKSAESGTKFPEIRKFPENSHAYIIHSRTYSKCCPQGSALQEQG